MTRRTGEYWDTAPSPASAAPPSGTPSAGGSPPAERRTRPLRQPRGTRHDTGPRASTQHARHDTVTVVRARAVATRRSPAASPRPAGGEPLTSPEHQPPSPPPSAPGTGGDPPRVPARQSRHRYGTILVRGEPAPSRRAAGSSSRRASTTASSRRARATRGRPAAAAPTREDDYDQSGSQPDDSESGDCDTDSARDDFTSEQTGVPRCRFFAAGYCRQGGQCRFAH